MEKLSKFHPISLFLTWGVGNIPKAPGTWGSLVAFPLAFLCFYFFHENGVYVLTALVVFLFFSGILASDVYMKRNGRHDPKEIIVDEIVGQIIVLLAAFPYISAMGERHKVIEGLVVLLICFGLFRFFDIVKPSPINIIDKKVMGGLGVMLDDVVAGIFAAIVFYVGVEVYVVDSLVAAVKRLIG
jgi:phosphatidylglycerophosphatase A